MIGESMYVKRYSSAKRRFLQSAIEEFLELEIPKTFGPIIRKKLAEKMVELISLQLPAKDYLRPGQMVWNAVSVKTRPNAPNCQFVPIILTLIDESDVNALSNGTYMSQIAKKAIARICREAREQEALLSMRDIGLFCWRQNSAISALRKKWEKDNNAILPHVGSVQDFGSCVTHKAMIVRKVIGENKDPLRVSRETHHSQRAVDRYLKDFHRVKTCYKVNQDIDFISTATGLSKRLICQYLELIEKN